MYKTALLASLLFLLGCNANHGFGDFTGVTSFYGDKHSIALQSREIYKEQLEKEPIELQISSLSGKFCSRQVGLVGLIKGRGTLTLSIYDRSIKTPVSCISYELRGGFPLLKSAENIERKIGNSFIRISFKGDNLICKGFAIGIISK